ncbi:MAG: polysaccharide biosynthesis tyrosine autokinase [Bacteroides sp.]|nr:polysaccharide biosynthesis tyrosine autokinase [Bacteroides sp.]
MENISKETTTRKKAISAAGTVPLTDIFFMTLRHWPWILLSVFICVGVAYMYLMVTPNIYTRAAEILIKEETQVNGVSGVDLSTFGLNYQSNTNIQNEVLNLKAKDLMEEVVNRLELDVNYLKPGRFHNDIVYGVTVPVKVDIVDFPKEHSLSFDLDVNGDGKVTISDMSVNKGEKLKTKFTGKLNDSISTPAGKIVVQPTIAYKKGEDIELIISKIPTWVARDYFNDRLSVVLSSTDASILRLSLSDLSVPRADDVLATLINVYNENWIHDKNQITVSTTNFINERLDVIERELSHVDSDISAYKSANMITDVSAAGQSYMSQNQANEAAMFDLSNQLSLARYMRSYLMSDMSKDQLLPSSSGLSSSTVGGLINEYNRTVLDRNSLLASSSENNPLVQKLNTQLAGQRALIIRTVDGEIEALSAQLESLRKNEVKTTAKLQANPTQAKELLEVERQQKVKEALYLFLLQKREENELTQAFTAYNTRIVNRPGPSTVPTTPDRGKILGIAFLIGLLIPFGVTYAREALNTTVRGRKDIEDLTIPFLGEIPLYGKNREKGKYGRDKLTKAIVVKGGKRDVINEAFRVLRTNLEFMKIHKDEADVVALTSFNPGSGKSFLTMNLATVLSLKNKKVVVIDGDMRHGSSSAYIGSPETGLSDVLNGSIPNVEDVIVHTENNPNLDVIPVGTVPPNPTELLETPRLSEILAKLRKEYDYVIIDCPPIEVVADAQIIDKLADRTVFVLRAGLLERSMLPQVEKLFDDKKFKNMATILNGTEAAGGRYGRYGRYGYYGYSYRYGYGYGYGYGYNYSSGDKGKSSQKS